ncbi:hypothetical protein OLP40_03820 [Campylobacter jejuni]|nr:hypothetical protein [Campylobacter jejuni]MCW1359103.1 hypothetical protein [Campylobacter jejuni]HDZ4932236.1 hypothetical protein [Campylobacter jejuni]HDZ4936956.1 hypothetical protein [Campylobacter jejuni]HDZ4940990.1 hypothetical protein [Campylobacter jejuni]
MKNNEFEFDFHDVKFILRYIKLKKLQKRNGIFNNRKISNNKTISKMHKMW